MRTFVAFIRLARPKFLLGGFAGFALGAGVAAYAGARLDVAHYLAGQTMVTAFHLMTHFANDFFDRDSDRHGRPTAFSGGSGVLVEGRLASRAALVAALACAAIGALASLCFAAAGYTTVAILGAAIGVCAWSYSAPPLRLAGRGWGEADAVLVVGVLVPLTGFALFAGSISALAVAATVAPACAMLCLMIAVEWPDRAADATGGKHNLLVRLGPSGGARLARAGALLIIPGMLATRALGAPPSGAAFGILLVPAVAGFVRLIGTPGAVATDVAARGVTVFLLTVILELFGYVCVLR